MVHRYPLTRSVLTVEQEPNDLSFSSGEIVEIVDETNADWWTGKCRGRQGLFPSNHVEKIDSLESTSPAPPPRMAPQQSMPPPPQPMVPYGQPGPQGYAPNYVDEKQTYRPYGAPYQPAPMAAPMPPPPQQVIVEQAPPPKKSRFGGLGNTVSIGILIESARTCSCGNAKLMCTLYRWQMLRPEVSVSELVSDDINVYAVYMELTRTL